MQLRTHVCNLYSKHGAVIFNVEFKEAMKSTQNSYKEIVDLVNYLID